MSQKSKSPAPPANPHGGHRERLRELVRRNGLKNLLPHQILEYILFTPIPRRDTNPIAHALLDRFGSLAGVFNASIPELMEVTGIGQETAIYLNLIANFYDEYGGYVPSENTLSTDISAELYFEALAPDDGEYLIVTHINAAFGVVMSEVIKASLDPAKQISLNRAVAETFDRKHSCGVLLAHISQNASFTPDEERVVNGIIDACRPLITIFNFYVIRRERLVKKIFVTAPNG